MKGKLFAEASLYPSALAGSRAEPARRTGNSEANSRRSMNNFSFELKQYAPAV
jgi:hypothetical protein